MSGLAVGGKWSGVRLLMGLACVLAPGIAAADGAPRAAFAAWAISRPWSSLPSSTALPSSNRPRGLDRGLSSFSTQTVKLSRHTWRTGSVKLNAG